VYLCVNFRWSNLIKIETDYKNASLLLEDMYYSAMIRIQQHSLKLDLVCSLYVKSVDSRSVVCVMSFYEFSCL
jgi:hypothetical protein